MPKKNGIRPGIIIGVGVVMIVLIYLMAATPDSKRNQKSISKIKPSVGQQFGPKPQAELKASRVKTNSKIRPQPEPARQEQLSTNNKPGRISQIQKKLAGIARDFAHNIKFPPYSMVLNKNSGAMLKPNEFIPFKRNLTDGYNNLTYTVILPSSLILKGSAIPVTLKISSKDSSVLPPTVYLKSNLRDKKKPVAELNLALRENEDHFRTYYVEYIPDSALSASWNIEMDIKIEFQLEGYPPATSITGFRYPEVAGEINGVGQDYVEGAHLMIPMSIYLEKPGYYNLSANLYSASTNDPIAHIQAGRQAEQGESIIPLKVHIQALKFKRDEGPYLLKTIIINKNPDAGQPATYILGDRKEYSVSGYAFDQYDDVPYQNTMTQKKLNRFKNMIGTLPDDEK